MAKRRNNEDDQSQTNENQNDADNFGLPDIEYKPLEPQERTTETTVQETTTYSYQEEKTPDSSDRTNSYSADTYEEEKSNAPMIIGLIIALVVVVAGFLIYNYVYKPQAEKAKKEQLARENERKRKEEEARLAKEREEAEERRRREEAEAAANAKPAIGTIETLSARTKRYYVVISSSIDDDLVMDYAKKLSAKGVSSKIIPPYGKYNFYRLTIKDFDSFNEAQSNADAAKAEYGDGLWVIKY